MKIGRLSAPVAMILLLVFLCAFPARAKVSINIIHSFPGIDGEQPYDSLTLSKDGNTLYGMTHEGNANDTGIVFEIDKAGTTLTVLHNFGDVANDGRNPYGSLTLSGDGKTLYGTTFQGGVHDHGTIFSYNIDTKVYSILHSFGGAMGDPLGPTGSLVLSKDGTTLYGTTASGGTWNNGYYGTVFSYNIGTGTCSVLHSFDISEGWYPQGGLTLSKDGTTLYGATQNGWDSGGSACAGTIFKIGTGGGALTYLHAFGDSDGAFPQGLTLSSDGAILYGVTNPGQGGWPGNGTIFSYDITTTAFTVIHTFGGSDGQYPQGSLSLSGDGTTLYGMTTEGGANDGGAVFTMDTGGATLTVLYSFEKADNGGVFPFSTGSLSLSGAILFGMRRLGGANNDGAVFKIGTGGAVFTVLHSFGDPGMSSDGVFPQGSLTFSVDGTTLYGMTLQGGANEKGTIFKMDTGGAALTVLHAFGDPGVSNDGQYSFGGSLTLSQDGATLYGMTLLGGANGAGAVFSYNINTTAYSILHSFGDATNDGNCPYGSLTLSQDGSTLYGMTYAGGANGKGVIFSYNISTTSYSVLHSFGDPGLTGDGQSPYGSLTLSSDGATLYGLTYGGGANGKGVIFSYNIGTTAYAILHSFGDATNDGNCPYGSLTLSKDGSTLYGMTYAGGANGAGTVFSYNIGTTAYSILHSFPDGANDGYFPLGSLTLSEDGSTLYGMTNGLGSYNKGTVFKMDTGGAALTVLHSFGDPGVSNDGQYPNYSSLTLGSNGVALYGMTYKGGVNGTGVILRISLAVKLDVNADGYSDVLVKNTATGLTELWFMNPDGSVLGKHDLFTDMNSKIVAMGDVNKDGICDLIKTNTATGQTVVWFMNADGTRSSYRTLFTDVDSTIVETGDFNGDGIFDLIKRKSTTGQTVLWFMNADGTRASYRILFTDVNSTIVGTGDYNGDGICDLIKRDTDRTSIWFMNADGTRSSYRTLFTDVDSTIVGTGDFNGDGICDLIKRKSTTGQTVLWFMNADGSRAGYKILFTNPNSTVAGTGDYNGDGICDLIKRDTDTGRSSIWFMNADGTRASYKTIFTNLDWILVP